MRLKIITLTILACTVIATCAKADAERATADEARTVATNWIAFIEHLEGNWGGFEGATVAEVQDFTREGRLLGYFCRIEPRGYIIISLLKNLAPVKAYSATCDIDPQLDAGMTDLIKLKMGGILSTIESEIGPIETIQADQLKAILDIDYGDKWLYFNRDVQVFMGELESGQKIDYQSGGILLTTVWHQGAPYSNQCPDLGCGTVPCDHGDNAVVGCVATAAAQILKHWDWPPYAEDGTYSNYYDWPNMPNSFTGCTWDVDEDSAVAKLCAELGQSCNMNYGCNISTAQHLNMQNGYKNDFYISGNCRMRYRSNFDWPEWWDLILAQLNLNRPIHYGVEGHSLVCDGWAEPGGIKKYHMNYGWAGGVPADDSDWIGYTNSNVWYVLDALPWGGLYIEDMITNIYPQVALGSNPSGTYSKQTFPYRYVDRDATSESAIFEAGQHVQFLPNVTLTGTSTTGGTIRIEGSGSDHSILFTRGDETTGVRIQNGALTLKNGGSIVFR